MFYDEEYENEGKVDIDHMERDATVVLWRWIILITVITAGLSIFG